MRDEACSVDATDVVPETAQLTDEIGSLMNKCSRTAVEQFDGAAKIFEARRTYVRAIIDLARVLEINADQFKHRNHRIAFCDVMLALPFTNGAR